MGFIAALWLPILLSAVFVFIVSSILHMVFKYHESDFKKLPDEDGVMSSLRPFNIPPGNYFMPNAGSYKASKSPEFIEKMTQGPVALITVIKNGPPKMGKSLIFWFIYSIIVSIFAAYVGFHALGWGVDYLRVFRFVGCVSFMGYSLALLQESIWYGRNWCATIKSMFDGLIYALVTAGTFGWLWPTM